MKALVLGLLFLGLLSSCASLDPRTMPGSPFNTSNNVFTPDQLKPVEVFEGFQFDRPTTDRWVMDPRVNTRSRMILYQTGNVPPYTAFVFCQLTDITSGTASLEDFEKMLRQKMTQNPNAVRFQVLSIKTETALRQNQWCVYYKLDVLDRKPATSSVPLVTRFDGFFVLYPSEKLLALNAYFSQRAKPEALLESLDTDVKALLDSIVLLDKAGNRVE